MGILKQYMVQILVIATILVVLYLFRDKILGAVTGGLTGETLEEYKADLATVQNVDITELASDIYATIKTAVSPDGYISPEQFRANIAEIDRQLALQKAQ